MLVEVVVLLVGLVLLAVTTGALVLGAARIASPASGSRPLSTIDVPLRAAYDLIDRGATSFRSERTPAATGHFCVMTPSRTQPRPKRMLATTP